MGSASPRQHWSLELCQLKRGLFSFFFLAVLMFSKAQPGKDGTLTVSSGTAIVNRYCPVSASIAIGSNTLSVASGTFLSLCPGDLIMVYQAQGATINTTN